ncbi:MAG: HD domain-containing protein [Anaerolineaceae bacterium]|nr:HD domain-containing protein [Anaerolineaceae bacterium]
MNKTSRLDQQLDFLLEIDKLKQIYRRNTLADGTRTENTAEHSWHIAILAGVLQEYSNDSVNLERVLLMLLIHDIVEIDAGDTYAYDEKGYQDKEDREHLAAERIFSLLPEDQYAKYKEIWLEFEDAQTPESRFANAADRLMPLLHNYLSGGAIWVDNKIRKSQVLKRLQPMKNGSEELWGGALDILDRAINAGYIINDDPR